MSETAIQKIPPAPLARRHTEKAFAGGVVQVAVSSDSEGNPVNSLVKLTPRGTIQAIKTLVPLTVKAGELWQMSARAQNPETKRWESVTKTQITSLGYDKMNLHGCVSIHLPKIQIDNDGRERPNPYLHYEGPRLIYVRIHMMGLGTNSVGNVVLHENTLLFDTRNYLARDVWSKWTGKYDESPKAWGTPYPQDSIPDNVKNDPTKCIVETPIGLVLAVDLKQKEVITMFGEQLQRANFAERNARSICKRNILKTFFAQVTPLQITNAETGAQSWVVPVVSWPQMDHDFETMADLVAQAKNGKIIKDGHEIKVNVISTTEKVDDPEEVDHAARDEANEFDNAATDEPNEHTPGVDVPNAAIGADVDAEIAKHRATIRTAWDGLPEDIADDRLAFFGFQDGMSQVADCSDLQQLRSVADRLESEYLQHVQNKAKEKSKNQEKEL